jgi:hypothetical protein
MAIGWGAFCGDADRRLCSYLEGVGKSTFVAL